MKKLIFLAFVIAIISAGCSDTSNITITVQNTTSMTIDVYNPGDNDNKLGTVGVTTSRDFTFKKDTCLDFKKYNGTTYLSTFNQCFSENQTVFINN
jgi:hypothetical protein